MKTPTSMYLQLCTRGRAGSSSGTLCRGTARTSAMFQVHFYFPSDVVLELIHEITQCEGLVCVTCSNCSVCAFACSSVPQGSEPWQKLWLVILLISAIFLHWWSTAGCLQLLFFLQVLIYFSNQFGKLFWIEIEATILTLSVFPWFGNYCFLYFNFSGPATHLLWFCW